jgi:NADH-quinone oxidoreductase subunit M
MQGAMIVMLSHGLSTGAMFLLLGMLYERRHTRNIDDFGGLAAVAPGFAAVFVFTALASIGLPGTSGFVGEFLALLGTFQTHPWVAVIARPASSSPRTTCCRWCRRSVQRAGRGRRTSGCRT